MQKYTKQEQYKNITYWEQYRIHQLHGTVQVIQARDQSKLKYQLEEKIQKYQLH